MSRDPKNKKTKKVAAEAPTPLTEEEVAEEKSKYTRKIYTPIYEPTGKKPLLDDLYDTTKRDELVDEIEADDELSSAMKEFLLSAAERHVSFDFAKIAEFYSHLPIKYKSHFENSALVIIDYDKAVRNGFIAFDKEVQESREDYLENIISVEKLASNKEEMAKKRLKRAEEELEYLKSKKKKPEAVIDLEEW
jgi:hypothetical protein